MSYSTRSLVNQINKVRKYAQDVFINDNRVSDKVSDGLPTEEESFGIFDYMSRPHLGNLMLERSAGRMADIATIIKVVDTATIDKKLERLPKNIGCMPLIYSIALEDLENIPEAHRRNYEDLLKIASRMGSDLGIIV